jgi:anaerobic selenocysteine-containing dehydrogenase
MIDGMDKVIEKSVDRRSFLRGSALFAAALGLGVAEAFAQQPSQQKPAGKDKKETLPDEQNETLVDADGREYRVCPQCAANMYRQGRTWTCENCGYSYVE